jgi:hypothetical protein
MSEPIIICPTCKTEIKLTESHAAIFESNREAWAMINTVYHTESTV